MVDSDAALLHSARNAARLIAAGDLTSEVLVTACLARIASCSAGAFRELQPELALATARAADERRRSGLPLPSLHGVPVAITAALDASAPAPEGDDAAAPAGPARDPAPVAALRAAGAIVVGTASDTAGAAAAVSTGCVSAALGLETAGEFAATASRTGCFAFKPSFGLVPRSDVRMSAPSLDTIGILARTVTDLAVVTEAIQAYDSGDPATMARLRPPVLATATMDWLHAPRFAFVPACSSVSADAALREAFGELIEALGQDVMTVDIEALIARGELAAGAVERFERAPYCGAPHVDGPSRRPSAHAEQQCSAEDHARALGLRLDIKTVLGGVFSDHGTILTHAAPFNPTTTAGDPTRVWTYLGLPTISVPLLEHDGQPIGVLLVGACGDDGRLLRTARLLVENIARLS